MKNRMQSSRHNEEKDQTENIKSSKRMPVWALVVMDLLLTGACLCIFALYHHVLPRHLASEGTVVATAVEGEDTTFTFDAEDNVTENLTTNNEAGINSTNNNSTNNNSTDINSTNINTTGSNSTDSNSTENDATKNNSKVKDSTDEYADNKNAGKKSDGSYYNYGNGDTTDIYASDSESDYIGTADKIITEVNSYQSENISFTTDKVELGTGSNKITYYLSDIYITNVKYLKTAFAYGEYGKNYKESTLDMSADNNALLTINGDYYGNNEIGVVIRNGILYRSEVYDADLCVLYTDGTMETYSPEEFVLDDIIAKGAWQAWIFGPELLDGQGNILSKFKSTYYLSKAHPRTAIGYVEPGHYIFLVADGRDEGYSRGVTLTELAQIMAAAGCVTAYNLDGGKSSEMVYEDQFVNQPSDGGRSVSDIIYIGEE